MKHSITFVGPILSGSISMAKAQCGKKKCKCKDKKPTLHGPYYRWTGIINGKRTTVTLDDATWKECKKRIDRYKKFQKKIDELIKSSLDRAPWCEK